MKHYVILGLKILGGVIAVIFVLLLGGTLLLNNSSFQNKVKDYATEMLEEKLETKVRIDSVSINLFTFDINLLNIDVEDREHRKMLQADRISVNWDIWGMLKDHINVSEAKINGVHARLYKPKDGEANYQFVLDAFKSKKPKEEKSQEDKDKDKKREFTLEVKDAQIADIDVIFNEDTFYLEKLTYERSWRGIQKGNISNLKTRMELNSKNGPLDTKISVANIFIEGKDENPEIRIDNLHFFLDNHLPRKNEGKPNRGFFDAGHLDVTANMKLQVNHIGKDTVNFSLKEFAASDTITGFNVKDLRFEAGVNKSRANLKDITFQHENTILKFDNAVMQLPSKKEDRKFAFQTSLIKGSTLLKDISRPFAPVLKNFTMPLELTLFFSGNDSTLFFKDVNVYTPDKRLTINAVGGIDHLKDKFDMDVHFHVNKMSAAGNVKQEIINQFAGKKMMMNQLNTLGTIHYTGDFHVLWKKEVFSGLLTTDVGNLNFDFTLDETVKYLTAHAVTQRIHLGRVLQMKDIGDVGLDANLKIDYDKERTAQMRKKYGGKLPIGTVHATVFEASYKNFKLKNLLVDIKSNGGKVEGSIDHPKKGFGWACDFSFTDIDKISNIKVKPKVKLSLSEIFSSENSNKKSDKKTDKKADQKTEKKSDKKASEKKSSGNFFQNLFKKKSKD